ncbi:alpha/beta fold hydrolase [Pantoea phytobeneficialis]|uniref:Alpha/beta hydrolase n=1 Tax=Pantoea phytobeneficialis TaxID=2052056 RepID=A0AAP9H9E6_9GAMM|nr:alpha/beta hydrolase [Pantoea phytobeneficialis]MDO6409437.1 alpha/beta hydrolase [Pantoea phytobeneficialis]QGR08916.1 alpha/beta hydrolase [Pantoea phytobeneficialis]
MKLPVVLIPGFMLDETLWDDFVDAFPDDREFIYANLSGGDSISAIAQAIAAQLPERFIVAGFSLGGYVARAIVEAFPARVAGMILIATSLREDTPAQRHAKQDAVEAINRGDFRGISSGAIKKSLHPARYDDTGLIGKIQNMGQRLGAAAFINQSGLIRDHITQHPIPCPVAIIAAQQDQLRSYQEALELAQLTGSGVELIEESGHMIPLEKPQQLAARVAAWLRKVDL